MWVSILMPLNYVNLVLNSLNLRCSPVKRGKCPKDVEHNSRVLKCRLWIVVVSLVVVSFSIQRVQCRKDEKQRTLQWKNLTSPPPRLISTMMSHVDNIYPWYHVTWITLFLCDLPPQKTHNSSLIMRKSPEKPKLQDIVQNASANTTQEGGSGIYFIMKSKTFLAIT